MTAVIPMPPNPNTAAVAPARAAISFRTIPAPFGTAQPNRTATSSGTPSGSRTQRLQSSRLGNEGSDSPGVEHAAVAGGILRARHIEAPPLDPAENHVVARRHLGDPLSDGDDLPEPSSTKKMGKVAIGTAGAADLHELAVANARIGELHVDLTARGHRRLDSVNHAERLTTSKRYRRFMIQCSLPSALPIIRAPWTGRAGLTVRRRVPLFCMFRPERLIYSEAGRRAGSAGRPPDGPRYP